MPWQATSVVAARTAPTAHALSASLRRGRASLALSYLDPDSGGHPPARPKTAGGRLHVIPMCGSLIMGRRTGSGEYVVNANEAQETSWFIV